jgi:hypothetical protein
LEDGDIARRKNRAGYRLDPQHRPRHARAFAREGAKVIVHSRHAEDAKKIAEEINGDFFVADT